MIVHLEEKDTLFNMEPNNQITQERLGLNLVYHLERDMVFSHQDIVAAGVCATMTILTDARAMDGEWKERFEAWGRIEYAKIIRRSRGAKWNHAQTVDGILIESRGMQIYAMPPVTLTNTPKVIKQLQVSGTDYPKTLEQEHGSLVTIAFNPKIVLTSGKAAAQGSHAGALLYQQLSTIQRELWRKEHWNVNIVTVSDLEWDLLLENKTVTVIQDAGHTEVDANTITAVGWWDSDLVLAV